MIGKFLATISVFLISYAGFLTYNIPSGFLVSRVNRQLAPANAHIADARGSAWAGHGMLDVNNIQLGRIAWDSSPWHLVTGHLQALVHIEGDGISARGDLDADSDRLRIENLRGKADLALLARVANMPDMAEGTVDADIKSIRLSGQGLLESATGEVDVHRLRLPALEVSLGTLFLHVDSGTGKDSVHAVINNSGGDLDINGQITLRNGTNYTLIAYLKPHPGQKNDPMRDALAAVIGAPDAQGRYRYVTSGRLSPP